MTRRFLLNPLCKTMHDSDRASVFSCRNPGCAPIGTRGLTHLTPKTWPAATRADWQEIGRHPVWKTPIPVSQGESVSDNPGSFSFNLGRNQKIVSVNVSQKRRCSQARQPAQLFPCSRKSATMRYAAAYESTFRAPIRCESPGELTAARPRRISGRSGPSRT